MDIHPDVLGEETMVLTQDDLTLDWGAKSLGIDLGFGYRVKRIILKPTSTTTRVTEDTLQVFASLYNLEDYYTEPISFTYEKDDTTGVITILFDTLQFARFIKIHSHFYEMDETGESLYNESTMTLEETDPFDVFILSSGRNEFYTYDAKGNRERLSYFTTSFTSYNYSYYPGSDLIKTDGKYGYKYDANGNMTEKGSIYTEMGDDLTIAKEDEYFRYEYDLLNRLERVYSLDEATGNEVFVKSYVYNAAGMRILAEDAEGIKTHYTFDLDGKVVEKETDGTIRNFFYLGSKVVAHKEAGETLYYGTDHLGSSVLMTDSTGATVWTGAVTPFADQERVEGLYEHVMFTGKELDTDTGLYYYNARWYDPGLGRFITEDPIRDGLNWFVYVNNNPLNFIDPTGLETVAAGINFSFTDIVNAGMSFVNKIQDKISPDSKNIFNPSQTSSYTASAGFYFDTDTKDFGFYGSAGTGGGTPDLTLSGEVLNSPLSADEFLTGRSTEIGGGVGYGLYGTQASVIVDDNNQVIGTENSIGIGLGSPIDFHADVEITGHISVPEIIGSIVDKFTSNDPCERSTE